MLKNNLLSREFLEKYKGLNPMKQLGSFVYYRTYSRRLPEEGRRETWLETVARAVEYNCSLVEGTTKEEAEELFDLVFNLRGFLSGRSFWIGGTEAVEKHALANFNCSLVVLNKFEKLKELFYALMCGCGVGFRVLEEDIENLPKIRYTILEHKEYVPVKKSERAESTSLRFAQKTAIIHVGDSKEGWSQAVDMYFDIISKREYDHIVRVLIEYDSIRPRGERLRKFGGTASGHESILKMFITMDQVIKRRFNEEKGFYVKMKAIDMLDFATCIASNVVVGGVRRSAEIGLMGKDSTECIQAKNNLYTQDAEGNWQINNEISHRALSNNTIIHWEKPDREFWKWQFEQMKFSGEPAFYNGKAALERNEYFKGTNPCGEVLLDDQQTCNLVTNNVMGHIENGTLNIDKMLRTHWLLTRASYRLTCVELEMAEWDYKLHRDRLLGVSLTGWQDMVNALDLGYLTQRTLLKQLRETARESADTIADELGCSYSKLVTTLKPEGTLSLLPGVSSGLHFPHSAYFVRRVRINANDALAKVCLELGYPVFPEVGSTWENATTLVIEFPVKSPEGKTKYDVSALEQLEIYKMFMEEYVDHNASITVSVRGHEWDEVENWMYDNWDSVIGISFLALDDSYYQLLPFGAITQEEYEERSAKMKPFNGMILSKYEVGEDFEVDSDCRGGVCPVR